VEVLPADTPDHPLNNTKEVSAFLADSINQRRRGELDPRVANGMGNLTTVLPRRGSGILESNSGASYKPVSG